MRNNQPVSQHEFVIRQDAAIISRTNAKGDITYVNDDFIEASGYERHELIGQPHNLVRHPDIPPEAFRDMWATIHCKRPWVGVVKNRRKDGGYYWVKATVTPTSDGDYMSVRVKATAAEIKSADTLYERMRNDPTLLLEGGSLRRHGLSRLIHQISDIRLSSKLWLSTLASMTVIFICLALAWQAIRLAEDGQPAVTSLAELEWLRTLIFGMAGGILILWPSIAGLIIREFKRPIHQVMEAARMMATLDLRTPIPGGAHDEVGQLLCQLAIMRNHLQENASLLKQTTSKLDTMAQRLSQSSREAANSAETQASVASNMAASVEELSVSIDHVSAFAGEAEALSRASGASSQQGCSVISNAAGEIVKISEAVDTSAGAIHQLESYSVEISTIVAVIREIADQTNLLALNAAIEAARAGEQGRGFAVVADEVRKLAERTSQSTTQITGMISKVQSSSRHAVQEMENSVKKVANGLELAKQAGDSISAIESGSESVLNAVNEITRSIREQGVAAREIARNVEQVAQMTEQGSHASASAATLAADVTALSSDLRRLAETFKV